ncbi:transposase [Actinophytocola sp.]|uniref:transposase n=1 Tax=Actinophytocola sp. TaxID=1872138 RepID=UPI0039C8A114
MSRVQRGSPAARRLGPRAAQDHDRDRAQTSKPEGLAVIPRRWAVERTLAWLASYRRLARDYERPITSEAIIRWAAITTMTGRIARRKPANRPGPLQFTTA